MNRKQANILVKATAINEVPFPEELPEDLSAEQAEQAFRDYIQKAYFRVQNYLNSSSNPVEQELVEFLSSEKIRNATAQVFIRRQAVQAWCTVNDPVVFDEDADLKSEAELLDDNDINSDPETLKETVGEKGYQSMIDNLRPNRSGGLTETEKSEQRESHFGNYEPAYPSEKTHDHNSGGTTRSFHWSKQLKPAFIEDHKLFLDTYNIEDVFFDWNGEDSETEES